MGTWGTKIREDDLVLDVQDEFIQHLKREKSLKKATAHVRKEFADVLDDDEDGPLFWIALADIQWQFGPVDPAVIRKVISDFKRGRGLDSWKDASEKYYKKRVKVLETFIRKIETPNERPKKLPRIIVRKSPYQPGDCLCVKLSNGKYGAAFVLVADDSDVEYGTNLIGIIDYLSNKKPTLDVYNKRKWLKHAHGGSKPEPDLGWYTWIGYKSVKSRLEVVGNLPLKKSDPKTSAWFHSWDGFGEQLLEKK